MDATVIGVLGTISGAALGLAGAARISQLERNEHRKVEMRQVYARFLAAIYSAVSELRELPPGSEGSTLAKVLDHMRGEDATFVQTRKELAAMGNTHFARMDKLNAAIAEVQVIGMPDRVVKIVNEAGGYVQRLSDERTDAVKAEWPEIFGRLQEGAKELSAPLSSPTSSSAKP